MRIFKDLKFVEQLGSGVQRILKAYGKEIFKFSTNYLQVTFPIENAGKNAWNNAGKNAGEVYVNLNRTQKEIVILLLENQKITQEEIGKVLNRDISTIQRNMKKLQKEKLIERIGSTTAGYWKVL